MSTPISEADAATSIISLWKGSKIRKIFSSVTKIDSWDSYYEKSAFYYDVVLKNQDHKIFEGVLLRALDKARLRLRGEDLMYSCAEERDDYVCDCDYDYDCYSQNDDEEDDRGDWMWNEGGYNDW